MPTPHDRITTADIAQHTAAFAVGLLLMGFASITYWQQAYMMANPDVGSISSSTGGAIFYVLLFLAGATLVFNGVVLGFAKVYHRSG